MSTLPPSLPGYTDGPSRITGPGPAAPGGKAEGADGGFASVLSDALNHVDAMQTKADAAIEKVATGEMQDVHSAMIAFEQARLSMQMLVEVRNKLVEAYQDITRMPL
ncbi:MAG: hypothetical protein AMXMBFR7_30920 [Planctomycetota bacterium]